MAKKVLKHRGSRAAGNPIKAPRPRATAKRATRPVRAQQAASKLDAIIAALRAPKGATVGQLCELTGWLAHSVRGAMSGALKKKRGLAITSTKSESGRVYRLKGEA